jgi:hypothetical protein
MPIIYTVMLKKVTKIISRSLANTHPGAWHLGQALGIYAILTHRYLQIWIVQVLLGAYN